ncbi:MAG: hypothetical protein KDD69_18290, partial [Bdellovibrionales bacterium]|nr:hypothetical protein [Bdellovibrionales bacterium]
MPVKALSAPAITDDERAQLVTDLMALRKPQICNFLVRSRLAKTGSKEVMRTRIEEALNDNDLSPTQIVQFLDEVVPWGKQHVLLFKGPKGSIADWKSIEWLADHLKQHRLMKYLNATLPLALPEKMKISSIRQDRSRLRIMAVKRRDWWERASEYDDTSVTREGEDVMRRAFVHRINRSLVAFEWDLTANTAMLQISELPTGTKYEQVAHEFFELIKKWFNINLFQLLELSPAIKRLHELEEAKTGEVRSHGIDYRTLEGRRFTGQSASSGDSLLGEAETDAA